jgi:hypothetical protein
MLGLPQEGIDGVSGEASFRVDDQIDLTLTLTADGRFLWLKALILMAADPAHAALHERIATANYAGALTGGGALGLNPVNGEVLLFQELPATRCEASDLQTVVARFVDAAIRLKSDLSDEAGPAAGSTAAPSSAPASDFQRPTDWLRG